MEDKTPDQEFTIEQLAEMLPGGLPAGFLTKLGKQADRYYRGPTKTLRKRSEVVAKRRAQKAARKAQRGTTRGQQNMKGKRNRIAAT